ncbi:MAG: ASPIC/UnbV domain-containing protein [Gemmataceae bacterium]
MSQSELAVTFGLDELREVDRIEIRWPNRERIDEVHRTPRDDEDAFTFGRASAGNRTIAR